MLVGPVSVSRPAVPVILSSRLRGKKFFRLLVFQFVRVLNRVLTNWHPDKLESFLVIVGRGSGAG